MALNIVSNFAANVAHRNLVKTDMQTTSSLSKLSSGTRVVSARDDAASLAIGSRLRSEVEALKQAKVNAGQAGSMLQIADGAMSTVSDILVRMKALAVQAASDQLGSTERSILNSEFTALRSEIDRIANDTEFNGVKLTNGSTSTSLARLSLSAANTDIGVEDGVASILPDSNVGNSIFQLSYDSTLKTLSLKDVETGAQESVVLTTTSLTGNQTESVRFDTVGVTVVLNASFNFGSDITVGANTTTLTGSTAGAIDTIKVTGVSGDVSAINTTSVTASGNANAVTFSLAAGDGNGSFTSAAVDLTSTGTKTVDLTRTVGTDTQKITISFNVATAFAGSTAAVTGGITLNELKSEFTTTSTSSGTTLTFKVGTGTTSSEDDVSFTIDSITTVALGIGSSVISGSDSTSANSAVTALSSAIDTINQSRSTVGASQNRLEFASANLAASQENAEAARSELLDLDIASEITTFTSKQVLLQAGVSMLAQANQIPQNLLRLLQ